MPGRARSRHDRRRRCRARPGRRRGSRPSIGPPDLDQSFGREPQGGGDRRDTEHDDEVAPQREQSDPLPVPAGSRGSAGRSSGAGMGGGGDPGRPRPRGRTATLAPAVRHVDLAHDRDGEFLVVVEVAAVVVEQAPAVPDLRRPDPRVRFHRRPRRVETQRPGGRRIVTGVEVPPAQAWLGLEQVRPDPIPGATVVAGQLEGQVPALAERDQLVDLDALLERGIGEGQVADHDAAGVATTTTCPQVSRRRSTASARPARMLADWPGRRAGSGRRRTSRSGTRRRPAGSRRP